MQMLSCSLPGGVVPNMAVLLALVCRYSEFPFQTVKYHILCNKHRDLWVSACDIVETVLPAGAYLWFGCSLWANCVLEQCSSTLAAPKHKQIFALKPPHARAGRRKVWTRHVATVTRPRGRWVRWLVEQAALAIGSAAALNVGQRPKRWPSVSHVCSASSGIRLVYFFSCVCLCFAQGAAFAEFCIAS